MKPSVTPKTVAVAGIRTTIGNEISPPIVYTTITARQSHMLDSNKRPEDNIFSVSIKPPRGVKRQMMESPQTPTTTNNKKIIRSLGIDK